MKKISALIVAVVMIAALAAAAIPASAATSFAPNGTGWDPNEVITVKKADPAKVVKDGVIGDGEYERYYADLDGEDECTSPLFVVAFNGASIDNAFAMLKTMEYYFSWDETHGFNFAVRNKPVVVQQLLEVRPEGDPQDDFARNTAYVINFKTDDGDTCLFYALGRRTDTMQYLEGYYTSTPWLQSGAKHAYDPVENVDYVITYGADGYVTIEWSIPLDNFFVNGGGAGSKLEGTICATAGTAVVPFGEISAEDSYAIDLGDFGYGVDVRSMKTQVPYQLSAVPVSAEPPQSSEESSEDPTDEPTSAPDTDEPNVDDPTGPAVDQTEPQDSEEGGSTGGANADPTDSDEPTTPGEPTNPDEPTDSDEPTNPGEPTNPDEPTDSDEPTTPGEPTNPGDPTTPGGQTNPGEPTPPGGQTNPGEPTTPGGQTNPGNGGKTPATGDPMIVLAAVAAVSAAGAVIVAKKRK